MRMSSEISQLATALAKAQGQIDDASKDSVNPHYRAKYADLSAVRAAIREPLSANGLAYIQLPRVDGNAVEVETMLIHASGEFISEVMRMPVSKADAHGIGSATSYARRYALMAIVGIAAEDDDGNHAVKGSPDEASKSETPAPAKREPTINAEASKNLADFLLASLDSLPTVKDYDDWRELNRETITDKLLVADRKRVVSAWTMRRHSYEQAEQKDQAA